MTTPNFLILRPPGSGYSLVPTERDDAPMFHKRYIMLPPGAMGTFSTGVKHEDYCSCICGWNFDAPGTLASALLMEKNMTSGFWDLTWLLSAPPGPMWRVDVHFTAHGLCQAD